MYVVCFLFELMPNMHVYDNPPPFYLFPLHPPTLPVLRTLSSLPLPFPILLPLSYPPIPAFPHRLPSLAPSYPPPVASPTLPPPSQLWRRPRQPVPAWRRHLAGGRPDREADPGGAAPRGGGGGRGAGEPKGEAGSGGTWLFCTSLRESILYCDFKFNIVDYSWLPVKFD